ncbi:MAG: hypothetical protein ABW190_14705, partial [Rhizobacter sp.]
GDTEDADESAFQPGSHVVSFRDVWNMRAWSAVAAALSFRARIGMFRFFSAPASARVFSLFSDRWPR